MGYLQGVGSHAKGGLRSLALALPTHPRHGPHITRAGSIHMPPPLGRHETVESHPTICAGPRGARGGVPVHP